MKYWILCILFACQITYGNTNEEKCFKTQFTDLELEHWGLKSLNLPTADKSHFQAEVIVAVIDTGVDINHESLKNSLWQNPGETGRDKMGRDKRTNGIDDDNNGYIDDVHGWDFVSNSGLIKDSNGHGTHISGIIAGKSTPCGGIQGVAPQAKIMSLKYYHPLQNGPATLAKSVAAMNYAIQMGAQIINYSGGGISPDVKEEQAIERARKAGILVVAAAGNENSFADDMPYYPASYNFDNILSVAAVDKKYQLANFSNYGKINVDIGGPGVKIWSSLPGNRYGFLSGTSQATAFLTGVSALILSQNPGLKKPEEIIHRIQMSRLKVKALFNKTQYSGVVDAGKSLSVYSTDSSLNGGYTHSYGIMKKWFVPNQKDSILLFE